MAKLGLVLDCADPQALGEFWSEALGYTKVGTFGTTWVQMVDLEGNEFCVCDAGESD